MRKVVSETPTDRAQIQAMVERSEEILSAYKKAFEGFSEEELLLLDGIVLDQPRGRKL
jgi:hypothetical protein